MIEMFFSLLFAHYLADFPLQNDFLAKAKNHKLVEFKEFWPHALFGHGMIHGGFVFFLTGNVFLGMAEVIIHCITDYLKCDGKISLKTDQFIHIGCKLLWAILITYFIATPIIPKH